MPFRILRLMRNLHMMQEAGYTEPTHGQTAALTPIIAGNDLIDIAQTSAGARRHGGAAMMLLSRRSRPAAAPDASVDHRADAGNSSMQIPGRT